MTDTMLTFYPWHREGLATLIKGTTTKINANISVEVEINNLFTTKTLKVYGPGDVLGINEEQVIRTEPPAFTHGFETNLRPYIEFDRPDFPWIFTPLEASGDKLTPWLCLIVLKKSDFQLTSGSKDKLPTLTCLPGRLPRLEHAAYWAHAQSMGTTIENASDAKSLSRLVAPFPEGEGQLEQDTAYQAFVVPVFKVGKQAGLKKETLSNSLDFAWTASTHHNTGGNITLPVYHSWEFSTAANGDFKSLAKRLKPWQAPSTMGTFEMAINNPTLNNDWEGDCTLKFAGALMHPNAVPSVWETHDKSNGDSKNPEYFRNAMKEAWKKDLPPPMYGRWHAKVNNHNLDNQPDWIKELNFNPHLRVAAGLGVQVIQKHQDSLMRAAWKQIEHVESANKILRQAQLAREVSNVFSARINKLDNEAFLQFSSMTHAVIAKNETSIQSQIKESDFPDTMLSPAFRRLSRPSNLRRKKIKEGIGSNIFPTLKHLDQLRHVGVPNGLGNIKALSRYSSVATSLPLNIRSPNNVRAHSVQPTMYMYMNSVTKQPKNIILPKRTLQESDINNITKHTSDIQKLFNHKISNASKKLNIESVVNNIKVKLEPSRHITAFAKARVIMPTSNEPRIVHRPHSDSLAPVMAGPIFDEPVYDDLIAINNHLLLPGIENIPRNSVSLLACNPAFVNAFMVGLNFEMARELLWRSYPTDQRGTYFKNFWPRYSFGEHDIKPITDWKGNITNPTNGEIKNTVQSVFLIRGELLQRYPGLVVSIVKAKSNDKRRAPDVNIEKLPVFSGALGKDTYFFGFTKKVSELLSHEENEGWYLLLEQQSMEVKFDGTSTQHAYKSITNPIRLYFHADSLLKGYK